MKKYFCDSCGEEIKANKVISVDIPCHLYSKRNDSGYEDLNGNRTSGRMDTIELCQKCANKAYSAFVDTLKKPINNQ